MIRVLKGFEGVVLDQDGERLGVWGKENLVRWSERAWSSC